MRRALAASLVTPLVAFGASACGSSKPETTARPSTTQTQTSATPAQGLVATLDAPNHTPKINQPWRITVTAHDASGKPVRAHVQYLFLFNGAVVARRDNYAFDGSFHDVIQWPAQAVGLPLTFRAQVSSAIGSKALDYPVTVSR